MKKLLLMSLTALSLQVYAQNPTVSTMPVVKNPDSGILKNIILGMKSYNDSGRFGFQNKDVSKDAYEGRTYKGKHEAKLGYKTDSGWGGFAQMTQYRYDYSASTSNMKWSASDPSLTLVHPLWYNGSDLKVIGFARYYLPLTDRSKLNGVRQVAYYLDTAYAMDAGQEIFNEVNPRMFVQDRYAATDTRVKVEDITVYTRKIASWGRYGIGQWTQFEQHAESADGLTMDVYPMFDYLITPKIFVGPRLYMPLYVRGNVYDGSRNTTMDNAYAELYFQASL